MVNDQVLEHVREQQSKGVPAEHIRRTLLAQGYSEANIEEVLGLVFIPASPVIPQRRSSKKIMIIVVVTICVALLAGGGAYAYFAMMHTPQKVLGEMFKKLPSTYAYQFSGELTADVDLEKMIALNLYHNSSASTEELEQVANTAITFSGFVNNQDTETPQSQITFGLSSDLPELTGKESLSIRSLGKVFYFNIVGLPPMIAAVFIGSDIDNQWIKVDTEALVQQFGLTELQQKIEELQSKNEPTDEDVKKVQDIVRSALPRLVSVTGTLPSEKVDGVSSYHYGFAFDIEAGKNMVDDLVAAVGHDSITDKQIQNYKKSIERLSTLTGEVWIGKKDFLPYKVVLHVDFDDDDLQTAGATGVLSVTFSQYNVPQTVQVPEGAKPIEELFAGFAQALFPPRPTSEEVIQQSLERRKDDDNDGLNNYREKLYKTDPNNPDTDSDGFTDGDEVKNHYNPLGPGKAPTLRQTPVIIQED